VFGNGRHHQEGVGEQGQGGPAVLGAPAADLVLGTHRAALTREGIEVPQRSRVWGIVTQMANDPFRAVAHPIRRGIVERLARGPATVGVVTRGFGVSKPTISKHLKVLERAGVVVRTVQGRTHRLELNVVPLVAAAEWFDRQRVVWTRMFDAVDDLLSERKERP
jgi:DNA-binding transcriptional ArsR family regulator